jgi:hypothetical protein
LYYFTSVVSSSWRKKRLTFIWFVKLSQLKSWSWNSNLQISLLFCVVVGCWIRLLHHSENIIENKKNQQLLISFDVSFIIYFTRWTRFCLLPACQHHHEVKFWCSIFMFNCSPPSKQDSHFNYKRVCPCNDFQTFSRVVSSLFISFISTNKNRKKNRDEKLKIVQFSHHEWA